MAQLVDVVTVLVTLMHCRTLVKAQEVQKVSQCFMGQGIPRVTFSCQPGHMLYLQRAFHGIALQSTRTPALPPTRTPSQTCRAPAGQPATNCSFCQGDCTDESMNLVYVWSTCVGNRSCARTVMQSYIPSCPGANKVSDYLQVDYKCLPRAKMINMCSNVQKKMSDGFLMSPNYPGHYPPNKDCMCTLRADGYKSRLVLSFYDLLLETKGSHCRADWLMLRQNSEKHRHCGAILTGTKTILSEGNAVSLQFHSDGNDTATQTFQYFTRRLKGFWMHFKADPGDMVHVNCRPLTPTDTEVEEIRADDNNYYTEGSRKTPTTPTLHPTLPTTSRDREITLREETREYAGGETAGEEYQVEEVLARGNGSEQMETGGNQNGAQAANDTPVCTISLLLWFAASLHLLL